MRNARCIIQNWVVQWFWKPSTGKLLSKPDDPDNPVEFTALNQNEFHENLTEKSSAPTGSCSRKRDDLGREITEVAPSLLRRLKVLNNDTVQIVRACFRPPLGSGEPTA